MEVLKVKVSRVLCNDLRVSHWSVEISGIRWSIIKLTFDCERTIRKVDGQSWGLNIIKKDDTYIHIRVVHSAVSAHVVLDVARFAPRLFCFICPTFTPCFCVVRLVPHNRQRCQTHPTLIPTKHRKDPTHLVKHRLLAVSVSNIPD